MADDLIHRLGTLFGRHYGGIGGFLNIVDERLNTFGRLAADIGQLTNFGGDNSKALSVLAGASCFHGGIEREHVGLAREVADLIGDGAYLRSLLA